VFSTFVLGGASVASAAALRAALAPNTPPISAGRRLVVFEPSSPVRLPSYKPERLQPRISPSQTSLFPSRWTRDPHPRAPVRKRREAAGDPTGHVARPLVRPSLRPSRPPEISPLTPCAAFSAASGSDSFSRPFSRSMSRSSTSRRTRRTLASPTTSRRGSGACRRVRSSSTGPSSGASHHALDQLAPASYHADQGRFWLAAGRDRIAPCSGLL